MIDKDIENKVVEEEEPFPYVPKDLLEKVQEIFDIRKMVWYETSRDTLMGIQQVVHFLEEKFKHQQQQQNGDKY